MSIEEIEKYVTGLDLDQHEISDIMRLVTGAMERVSDNYIKEINSMVTEIDMLRTEIRALTGYIHLKGL